MPDDYVVRARIRAIDETARGATRAERRLSRVEDHARRVSMGIGGALARGLMAMGSGYALQRLTAGIVGIHREIQQAEYGLASLFSASYQTPIVDSLRLARVEVQGLRHDAAVGVGELQHYLQAYQMILGPASAAGATTGQIRELTRLSLSAGFAMRGQEGLVLSPMDVVQAMTGGLQERQTPIAMMAVRAIGLDQQSFNAASTTERLEILTRAFGSFSAGVELMGQGWDAQMATFRDGVKELLRTATRPLFERWSEQLRGVNRWLSDNRAMLTDMAERIGPRLVEVYENLLRNAGAYAAIAAGMGASQMVGGVGGLGPAGLAGVRRGGAIIRGAAGAARSRVGGGLAGLMLQYGVAGGGLRGIASAAGMGAGGIVGALRGLLATLGRAGGPIAIITTAIMALVGAAQEFSGAWQWVTRQFGTLLDSITLLGESFGLLTGEGSVLNQAGLILIGVLGGLVWAIDKVVRAIASLVVGLGLMFRLIGAGLRSAYYATTGQMGKAAEQQALQGAYLTGANAMLRKLWLSGDRKGWKDALEDAMRPPDGKPPQQQVNIGRIEIHNNLETNADPARIAESFDLLVERITAYQRQSRRIPVPAAGI